MPDGVVLWRGEDLGGGDVDLVARPGRELEVVESLGQLGLAPWPERPGQTTWRAPGEAVVLDVWSPWAWPRAYPGLEGVLGRARRGALGLDVAAPEDRLLAFAIDAIAGRPLERLRVQAAAALAEPGARERLPARARAESLVGPARLVAAGFPDRADVLPLPRALAAGLRSRRGRLALLERVRGPLPAGPPGGARRGRGRLVALSGSDGSGKSSAALALAAELEGRGEAAMVVWTRLGVEQRTLDRLAGLVRRVLGREMGATSALNPASPVADRTARGPDPGPPPAGPLTSAWAALVAATYVRRCRRLARARRDGVHVVCDRWAADALVDLRLRYGRQPVAERLLRRGLPRPDLAALLLVPPEVAARRKPEDQDAETLARMQRLYAEAADALGLTRIDADRPAGAVRAELLRLTAG